MAFPKPLARGTFPPKAGDGGRGCAAGRAPEAEQRLWSRRAWACLAPGGIRGPKGRLTVRDVEAVRSTSFPRALFRPPAPGLCWDSVGTSQAAEKESASQSRVLPTGTASLLPWGWGARGLGTGAVPTVGGREEGLGWNRCPSGGAVTRMFALGMDLGSTSSSLL